MVLHGFDKGLAFFKDVSNLLGVKMDQWAIICLLPALKEPIVMLVPLGIELFGSDEIPMQRRADLLVRSKACPP
jgi:hypothetical protein